MFLRSSYPIEQSRTLHVLTESGNSKMAASKPEVPISQPIDMIGTRFERLYIYVFEVQLSKRTIKNIARPNWKWEFHDGGLQTGSTHVSAGRHDRNRISKAIPMFSESGNTKRLVELLSDDCV